MLLQCDTSPRRGSGTQTWGDAALLQRTGGQAPKQKQQKQDPGDPAFAVFRGGVGFHLLKGDG
ncbi:hypothetical protein D1970_12730 [Mesobacillus zeae]|uniref:Uncharacterized protein n=1 Tax=Mesobacillus zeae TaxID=1917180 RepID=A0A398B3E9_9BACI|nr:hypothetical protein D1970_12730 [Mesobacillus zeae]